MYLKSFDKTKIYYKFHKPKFLKASTASRSEANKVSDLKGQRSDLKANAKHERSTLIFIHGWCMNWTCWKNEINYFNKLNYPTIVMDLRGHGKSDKPESPDHYHFDCFAKDINQIIKKEKINNFILIGHSMGGMISLTYYRLFRKKPKALVLCDTSATSIQKNYKIKFLAPHVLHLIDLINSKNIKTKPIKEIDLSKYKNKSDYYIFFKGIKTVTIKSIFSSLKTMLTYDSTKILRKIKQPVLIIQAKQDKILPTIYSQRLFFGIKNAYLETIKQAKHGVIMRKPDIISEKILKFLKRNGF